MKRNATNANRNGFTIIEIAVAAALVALAAVLLYTAIDPARQFARARNDRRKADSAAIVNAIQRKAYDNRGVWSCAAGAIPATATRMASSSGNYNIAPCLTPSYLAQIPHDPNAPGASYISATDYDSAYTVSQNAASGTVTVAAPYAELGETISATR